MSFGTKCLQGFQAFMSGVEYLADIRMLNKDFNLWHEQFTSGTAAELKHLLSHAQAV